MRPDTLSETPKITRLADYTPFSFAIESVYLDFDLSPKATTVKSKLVMRRESAGPLELDGEEIKLKSIKVDGRTLKRSEYRLTQTQLILDDLPDSFTLEIENSCNPAANSICLLYTSPSPRD